MTTIARDTLSIDLLDRLYWNEFATWRTLSVRPKSWSTRSASFCAD